MRWRATPEWMTNVLLAYDRVGSQQISRAEYLSNCINLALNEAEALNAGPSTAPDTSASGQRGGYDPEAIFERVRAVRRERTANYAQEQPSRRRQGFARIGYIWGGILAEYLDMEPLELPGWLVATMMAALKCWRIVANPKQDDSYVDGINYTAIAEECYNAEQNLLHGAD